MTNDPNGRFVQVAHARIRPGVCLICNGTDGPFIQTKRFDPRINGQVYLCHGCLSQMGQVMDLTPDVNALAVAEARQAMQAEFDAKEKESFDVVIERFLVHLEPSLVAASSCVRCADLAPEAPVDGAPEADAGAEQQPPATDAGILGPIRDSNVGTDEDGSGPSEEPVQVFGTALR